MIYDSLSIKSSSFIFSIRTFKIINYQIKIDGLPIPIYHTVPNVRIRIRIHCQSNVVRYILRMVHRHDFASDESAAYRKKATNAEYSPAVLEIIECQIQLHRLSIFVCVMKR